MTSSFAPALTRLLATEIDRHGIPGLGVAIVRDGVILHAGGHGLADVEHQVRASADTVFHSGSTGKMFTAVAVLFLAADGKLGLDDPIKHVLAEGPSSWDGITIRHLLTMTSGLGNFDDVFAPKTVSSDAVWLNLWQDHSDEELFALAGRSPLAFAPGESYLYSNIGYILAALIVRRVSGKPYYDLLRERLFVPAGMASAREAGWFDIVPNRADGYSRATGQLRHRHWTAPSLQRTGDGGLYFSANDIARWFIELDDPKILSPGMIDLMFEPARLRDGRPAVNSYGLGWQNSEIRGHRKIRHGGTWDGFRAELARFPAQKLSVAVLANLEEAQVARIAHEVAGLVDPAIAPYAPIADNDAALTRRDHELVREIAGRRAPRAAFTDEAWRLWSDHWFDQALSEAESDLAAAPLELLDHRGNGAEYRRRYRLATGRYHMHWTLAREADGKVGFMRFHLE